MKTKKVSITTPCGGYTLLLLKLSPTSSAGNELRRARFDRKLMTTARANLRAVGPLSLAPCSFSG